MLAGQAARVFPTPRALVATGSPCAGSPCFRSMLSAPNNAPHLCQRPHKQAKTARRHSEAKWKLAGSVETLERRELHGGGPPNFNNLSTNDWSASTLLPHGVPVDTTTTEVKTHDSTRAGIATSTRTRVLRSHLHRDTIKGQDRTTARPAGAGWWGMFPHIVQTTKTFECDLLERRRSAIGDREEDHPIRTSFQALGTASLEVLRSLENARGMVETLQSNKSQRGRNVEEDDARERLVCTDDQPQQDFRDGGRSPNLSTCTAAQTGKDTYPDIDQCQKQAEEQEYGSETPNQDTKCQ
ncbi:hypothetical protein C8Q74DRAFT_1213341 [Fomes fomentarius]|nr:hypothetical protein C8Q74DRAFT_1213341 [Fomes fomentarius]